MGFLSWLFGGKEPPPPEKPGRNVAALMAPLAVPAVHAISASSPTNSYLGGTPFAPADLAWPTVGGRPLSFLAQIDLGELHACLPIEWLPPGGRLLFFYDVREQPWGFKPTDAEGWRVIWLGDEEIARSAERTLPAELTEEERLPRHDLAFRQIRSYPSYERAEVEALSLNHAESDALGELESAPFEKRPQHQLAGFPRPVQGDGMELEAQLVSHGVDCGEPGSYESPRAKMLAERTHEWRLLFQVDSDEAANVMWGDVGILYFWVREEDARAGRFDRVWLVLQCY